MKSLFAIAMAVVFINAHAGDVDEFGRNLALYG
jgi:hypothetical protein